VVLVILDQARERRDERGRRVVERRRVATG
jgi:hypothetical protein